VVAPRFEYLAELSEAGRFGVHSREGLKPPAEVRASPRCESVAGRTVPEKSEDLKERRQGFNEFAGGVRSAPLGASWLGVA
jgi:hypothetical protein